MEDWHFRWYCLCGHSFGKGPESTHLMFGFETPCPKCGESLGSDYSNQSERKLCRYVRTSAPFKLFDIKTWKPVKYKLEIKGE